MGQLAARVCATGATANKSDRLGSNRALFTNCVWEVGCLHPNSLTKKCVEPNDKVKDAEG